MPTSKSRAPRASKKGVPHLTVIHGDGTTSTARARDFHGFEDKYQTLFDQASDAILTVLPDGSIDAANQAVEEMTGYVKTELHGAAVSLLAPSRDQMAETHHGKPLASVIFEAPGTYEDVAIVRKDGYIRYVDLSVRLVKSGTAMLAMALFRDVTEKKRMERELITKHTELRDAYFELEKKNAELQALQETLVQAGKMAALGELSVGIAHELNQPLMGIRGYAQELESMTQGKAQPELAMALREIMSNVDKMNEIISSMRAFMRKPGEKCETIDVHQPIEESLKLMARQFFKHGIQVERHFDAKTPKVYTNPFQLEQVFINLASNARDAIDATGRGKGLVSITTRLSGDFVEIVFRDDGAGMNERTKAKAFNPFFTTKEVGKGTGLGLSLSYGILSKLQGSILVESELGKGTSFLIRIPKDFRELG